MPCSANILVIDDEESIRIGCAQALAAEGYRVQTVDNGEHGLEMINNESFDIIILDLKMPGIQGMEVLKRIKQDNPGINVIVITGYGTINIAVEAMRQEAYDFLTKPFTPEALLSAVKKAVNSRRRILENISLDIPLNIRGGETESIIGCSSAIVKIAHLIKKVAPTDSTVLIYGETGVGKELVAKTIHRLSTRRDRPFVTVDCGTLVETLFESEMFGHVKGSFTGATETTQGKFELAEGGTIFLDEIANITINTQSRLLRVIQEREISKIGSLNKTKVDVRITSATNKDLMREIQEGRFREDLFYRLNVVPIHIPPLRERREDIPILTDYFLKGFKKKRKKDIPRFSDEAMRFMEKHNWPGNVRELKNAVERAIITSESGVIGPEDLSYNSLTPRVNMDSSSKGSLEESEKEEITKVLSKFNGHKSKTAQYLGINRKTLRDKIRKYKIKT